ncbi:MATE family efflux transporter [Labilibaculum antarcticum]|uniref:Multidrug export protein MepA n=1 Tax=Labilibaculum antarcticum TaxID=1717717 RepID=A0A1Y1CRD9_9BACT|nr:MATE family efflux transporter [Labilibaculum antarcticum]BAX82553.1 MATE family efflux transporter [Labilibaculum antarcticum]
MDRNSKNVRELESASIKSLLWKYFLPAFTGVVINSLYNVVDRIFIGQGVGAIALSGLSAVFPIMLIMMAFGMLIGIGAGVRVSINLGKKDFGRAEWVLGNSFVLMIIVSVIITVIGFSIKDPLLRMFGVGDDTMSVANEYLNIILYGAIFSVVGFSLNNLIRSEGNAKIAMYSMLISAGTNVILDPIFIFVLDMGVAGAAYATIISQFILCIWVIRHFLGPKSIIKLRLVNFKLNWQIVFYILTIGFAPFTMQLAGSFVQALFNIQLVEYSNDIAIAAMGIINSIAMLIVMTVVALNMAAQPIFGFNYGAQNYARVKECLILCMKAATGIVIVGFLGVQLFPELIVKAFNNSNAELLQVGSHGLRIILLALPIVGFQVVVGNYFQSIGKAGISVMLTLMRQVILLIPILFILPTYFGLNGVWFASPISDVGSAIVSGAFLIRELRKLNRKIELQ